MLVKEIPLGQITAFSKHTSHTEHLFHPKMHKSQAPTILYGGAQ
jgi:hypothetical protein